jgi:D-arabinose 1-dehydrogenase-like Zn-dependent alcohol dehydrogenase
MSSFLELVVFLCKQMCPFLYPVHRHLCSFGAQIALASGATVIVTSSSDAKLEIAKKLGAQHLINYNTNPNWEDEVLKIVSGRISLVVFHGVTDHLTRQDRGERCGPHH